jgi:hypothetical protein
LSLWQEHYIGGKYDGWYLLAQQPALWLDLAATVVALAKAR